jgi:ketosteroid isomerase-like protein
MEVGEDSLMRSQVIFDAGDIETAFEELDARYIAGEAAPYARTWWAITKGYAALNRHEMPATTPDWVNIDHRRGIAFAPGETFPYLHATWDVAPDFRIFIEKVHRLTDFGAVVTWVAHGTSDQGFDAEWRGLNILTAETDLINRLEVFDEADLDAALARFDELDRPPPLENAATRTWARSIDTWNRRDIDAYLALMTTDGRLEDRRKGLGALLDGPSRRKSIHELFAPPESWRMTTETIAIRGSRLSLTRECVRDTDAPGQPVTVEVLTVLEVDGDGFIHDTVSFDPDNIGSAFGELTARWIASGEVVHPNVIEAHFRFDEIFNRHDWDAFAEMISDITFVDHRQLAAGGADTVADHMPSIRTMASLVPDLRIEQAEILTHSAVGLVTYTVAKGTSTEGAAIELPLLVLVLFDGDRVTRIEDFEPAQRDVALARFEEIGRG